MEPKTYECSRLSSAHTVLLDLVTPGSEVLEVGCATGYVTKHLSEVLGCRVKAIEVVPEQAALAACHADKMVIGDIEADDTWNGLGQFDAVIFGDVLEHLKDPWAVLRRTRCHLKPGGRVLASIPNIAHFRIRLNLLLGKFEYVEFGILDSTHLRFFTAASARRLFTETGYRIESFAGIASPRPFARLMVRVMPNLFACQFVIEAAPADS